MRKQFRAIPRLYFRWASAVDEGMTLELCEADESGKLVEGELVRIPLSEFEAAIAQVK